MAPSPDKCKRVLILIVAYNAEATIDAVLTRIPEEIFDYDYEILIIDDQSTDATFDIACEHKAAHPELAITVLFNPENQMYGGNQKLGYRYAIRNGFDVVALLHGDGQYAPEELPELVAPVCRGEADAVFGTRMARGADALEGGMPLYKFVGNRVLTAIQNRLLGTRLTEFHSGYRVYSVEGLKQIPFERNTNDFHFDTEIVIQFVRKGFRIAEVPIPTYYGDEICHVNGLLYAWNCVKSSVKAALHDRSILFCYQFDVAGAGSPYVSKLGFASSHSAAVAMVRPGSRVLDLGCGSGCVASALESEKGCEVTGVDSGALPEGQKVSSFARIDLSLGELPLPDDKYDYILLLDILEHLSLDVQFRLLESCRDLARGSKPTAIVTTGNVAFLPVRVQLMLGNLNWGRRGILDLTHRHLFTFPSLRRLMNQAGFVVHEMRGIPAPFPLAIKNRLLAGLLLGINRFLIWVWPGLFSYQMLMRAVALPTVEQLLELTETKSRERLGASWSGRRRRWSR